jgi:hypothetical protein
LAAFQTGNPEISYEKMKAVVEMPAFSSLNLQEQQRIKRNLDNFRGAAAQKLKIQQEQARNK